METVLITYIPNIEKKCIEIRDQRDNSVKYILKGTRSHKRAIELANELNLAFSKGLSIAKELNTSSDASKPKL